PLRGHLDRAGQRDVRGLLLVRGDRGQGVRAPAGGEGEVERSRAAGRDLRPRVGPEDEGLGHLDALHFVRIAERSVGLGANQDTGLGGSVRFVGVGGETGATRGQGRDDGGEKRSCGDRPASAAGHGASLLGTHVDGQHTPYPRPREVWWALPAGTAVAPRVDSGAGHAMYRNAGSHRWRPCQTQNAGLTCRYVSFTVPGGAEAVVFFST